jgi:hypothetical protein
MDTDERELLRGKLAGIFSKQSVVLTNKRLIAEEKCTYLNDIMEVYAEQERLKSKLVVRLKNGQILEYTIVPERIGSTLTLLSGDMSAMESEMRANSKAAIDRWVNLINSLLVSNRASRVPISTPVVGTRKFCRYCGVECEADAVFCENCGKQITKTPEQPKEDDAEARRQRRLGAVTGWICPFCKAANSPEEKTCHHCKKPPSPTT